MRSSFRSFHSSSLVLRIILGLFVSFLLSISFSGQALTSQTTNNQIQGSAPYLTFDGGQTRAVNTDSLLGITLSDGTQYTPSTNPSSSTTPIVLPATGQTFADIGMLVPTDTNSVALSTLIGPPYNYWDDEDGDGDISATGSLSLSIVDNNNRPVSRDTLLTNCNAAAPYRVTLTSTNGTLTTRYGVPNSSNFNASNVTYYVKPKLGPVVCFARPNLKYGKLNEDGFSYDFRGPATIWDENKGFLTQSTAPSSYGLNFPTTGGHGLYFDLLIDGNNQALSWAPVSHSGITATMTNSSSTSVRVTLTGPVATESQWRSSNPGIIPKPTLPQTFELVGRDSHGKEVAKYGFVLKQWFVNRGPYNSSYTISWCSNIGYFLPKHHNELTNATRITASTPSSSPDNHYQRRIGDGFFAEWGKMPDYSGANFSGDPYPLGPHDSSYHYYINPYDGSQGWLNVQLPDRLCVSDLLQP